MSFAGKWMKPKKNDITWINSVVTEKQISQLHLPRGPKQTNKNLFMSLHDLPLPLNSRSMIYEDMTRVITYMQHIYPKAFLEIIVTNVWETWYKCWSCVSIATWFLRKDNMDMGSHEFLIFNVYGIHADVGHIYVLRSHECTSYGGKGLCQVSYSIFLHLIHWGRVRQKQIAFVS